MFHNVSNCFNVLYNPPTLGPEILLGSIQDLAKNPKFVPALKSNIRNPSASRTSHTEWPKIQNPTLGWDFKFGLTTVAQWSRARVVSQIETLQVSLPLPLPLLLPLLQPLLLPLLPLLLLLLLLLLYTATINCYYKLLL